MEEIKLTPAQLLAIPILFKQPAAIGLKVRKFDGTDWYQLEYISAGTNGNWNITISKILLDNRDRSVLLAKTALDNIQNTLREQVIAGTLTAANSATLFAYCGDVMLALSIGWLRESRMICNNLTTTVQFTQARKDFMLNQIDAAIALL
jgi:hypothetical protein